MFEIRVICDPADTDRVSAALAAAFTTGPARQHPTHDGKRTRLYVSADHRPEPESWPTPEEAYALAPSIIREIGWTAQAAADKPFGEDLDRDYWLRKAALLDRIALSEAADGIHSDAADLATEAAAKLVRYDDTYGTGPDNGPSTGAAEADPRGYVRQEYAHWAKNQ